MRRRTAPLVLTALLLVPVLPVSAVEPSPSPAPSANSSPDVGVAPPASAPPSPELSAAPVTPEPAASASPAAATAEPKPDPKPEPTVRDGGTVAPLDASDRWIVILEPGTDSVQASQRAASRQGVRAELVFRALNGYAGRMTDAQVAALRKDPDVAAVVRDEIVEVAAQTIPTGVSRIGTKSSSIALIDGRDQRVDADVAIVDTGIDPAHPDLNVAGGVNCSTSDRSLWRDREGHGTHVAGTVGAIDNGSGVVGVAPGVRLWAVKILNDEGFGYLSWYVCGLDWIATQRDPRDGKRPLIEAVNMSVAKWGSDDRNCGNSSNDILHKAICRVNAAGVTVVAAAANDSGYASARVPAAYDEVITVSALADTDGRAGGLGGGRCYSWGGYDQDDTFADFSNYGNDVDIIAPGKCIWSTLPGNRYGYSSGTSMAAPAVAGAAALFLASRPWATPLEVKTSLQALGNLNWKTSTDPDGKPEKLLDVSRLAVAGDFAVSLGGQASVGINGGTVTVPVTLNRTSTHFEPVDLVASTPAGLAVSLDRGHLVGFTATSAMATVTVPAGYQEGSFSLTVTGTEGTRVRTATTQILVDLTPPVASGPAAAPAYKYSLSSRVAVRATWAAAIDQSRIKAYEIQHSMDWGPWSATWSVAGSTLSTIRWVEPNHSHRFRVRALDAAGNWSDWATGPVLKLGLIDDHAYAMRNGPGWSHVADTGSWADTLTRTTTNEAAVSIRTAGRQLALVAEVGPSGGWLEITVNGYYQNRVTLYNRTTVKGRVLWIKEFPEDVPMVVELKAVTAGSRTAVNVDALLVGR